MRQPTFKFFMSGPLAIALLTLAAPVLLAQAPTKPDPSALYYYPAPASARRPA